MAKIGVVTGWSHSGHDQKGHHRCAQTAQVYLKIRRAPEAHSLASETGPISKLESMCEVLGSVSATAKMKVLNHTFLK